MTAAVLIVHMSPDHNRAPDTLFFSLTTMTTSYQTNTPLKERVENLKQLIVGHQELVQYFIVTPTKRAIAATNLSPESSEIAESLIKRADEMASEFQKWGTFHFGSEPYYVHDEYTPEKFLAVKEVELLSMCREHFGELLDLFEVVKPVEAKEVRAKAVTTQYLTVSLDVIMTKMVQALQMMTLDK
jgi:hypothetical protein